MIFLVKENNEVRVFRSENEMKEAGFKKAGLTVTEEKFNSNGCYARLVNGEIVVGKTEKEIAEEEKQEKITQYKTQLDAIDRKAGASRSVREACVAIDALRVLMGITDQKINAETDPEKKKALQILKKFDIDTNKGLTKLIEFENEAEPIREQLAPLLNTAE